MRELKDYITESLLDDEDAIDKKIDNAALAHKFEVLLTNSTKFLEGVDLLKKELKKVSKKVSRVFVKNNPNNSYIGFFEQDFLAMSKLFKLRVTDPIHGKKWVDSYQLGISVNKFNDILDWGSAKWDSVMVSKNYGAEDAFPKKDSRNMVSNMEIFILPNEYKFLIDMIKKMDNE